MAAVNAWMAVASSAGDTVELGADARLRKTASRSCPCSPARPTVHRSTSTRRSGSRAGRRGCWASSRSPRACKSRSRFMMSRLGTQFPAAMTAEPSPGATWNRLCQQAVGISIVINGLRHGPSLRVAGSGARLPAVSRAARRPPEWARRRLSGSATTAANGPRSAELSPQIPDPGPHRTLQRCQGWSSAHGSCDGLVDHRRAGFISDVHPYGNQDNRWHQVGQHQ